MRTYLMLFFLGCYQIMNAQTTPALPLPTDGSVWVAYNLYSPWSTNWAYKLNQTIEPDGDLSWENSVCQITNCDNPEAPASSSFQFVENENKWYRDGSLFFDWNLMVGDSILLEWWGDYMSVSAIDTVEYADFVPRRVYHMTYDGNPMVWYNMEMNYIEGIGSSIWGLEMWDSENKPLFQCFYDKNGLLLYHNDWSSAFSGVPNSCCAIVSVEETTSKSFKLFPSPASNQTSLQFESAHIPQSIQIFNATGQLKHTEQVLGRIQMQVNLSEYAKGIYTVRGRFENGEEVSEKLVVE